MLWFKKKEERALTGEEDPVFRAALSGDVITKEMALQVPTVSGGIDLIANIIASTPIKLYMDVDGRAQEVKKDKRIRLLNDEPGDTLTANEFWRAVIKDYYTGKGGYVYIDWAQNSIDGLYYVDEEKITVLKNTDPIFKDYDIVVNGTRYPPYKFFRILRNTKDGAEGVPVTVESSQLISVAYNSLVFELNMAKRGGNKRGFLRSEKKLTDEALSALRTAFRKLYSGSGEDNFVLLNNGVDFKESSATGAEMQMNENKVTNAAEFAKIFHISTDIMSGKATDADISTLAKLAAIPLMNVIQSSLNRDMLLEKEKGTYYFAFDTKELLKGDMVSRFNAYKTAIEANFMQIDEVRYMEDMEQLGFNWIKLGLQDVLYNPQTGQLYTPNTGQMAELGVAALNNTGENGKIEPRANPNHDPKTGKFTSGPVRSKKKTKYATQKTNKTVKGVRLDAKEYSVVTSAFATNYPGITSGQKTFRYGDYKYTMKVNGFGDYTVAKRVKVNSTTRKKDKEEAKKYE